MLFDQPPRAPGSSLCDPGVPPSSPGSHGVLVHGQHLSSCLPPQTRGYPLGYPRLRVSVHPAPLRIARCLSASPVYSRETQRLGRLAQSRFPSVGLGVDPLPGGLPGSLLALAGQHRPLRYLNESPAPGVLLPDVGSPGTSYGRHVSELGRPPCVCLPSVWLHSQCPHQGSPIPEPGGFI